MKPNITLAEVEEDLENTINDEIVCRNIVTLIQRFITESGGEDRRAYEIEVLRWEALANQAARLKAKIQIVREGLLAPRDIDHAGVLARESAVVDKLRAQGLIL